MAQFISAWHTSALSRGVAHNIDAMASSKPGSISLKKKLTIRNMKRFKVYQCIGNWHRNGYWLILASWRDSSQFYNRAVEEQQLFTLPLNLPNEELNPAAVYRLLILLAPIDLRKQPSIALLFTHLFILTKSQ